MNFTRIAPFAAVLMFAAPALAQSTAVPTNMHDGQTPNNSGSGNGQVDPLRDATPQVDNCRQLMERAKSMAAPTNPDRTDVAEKELAMAQDAKDHGDYAACRDHSIAAIEAKK